MEWLSIIHQLRIWISQSKYTIITPTCDMRPKGLNTSWYIWLYTYCLGQLVYIYEYSQVNNYVNWLFVDLEALSANCVSAILLLLYCWTGALVQWLKLPAWKIGDRKDSKLWGASDHQGTNFESCVWRTSQSFHHPQEVLLAQFSLHVHKGGLKPNLFYLYLLY